MNPSWIEQLEEIVFFNQMGCRKGFVEPTDDARLSPDFVAGEYPTMVTNLNMETLEKVYDLEGMKADMAQEVAEKQIEEQLEAIALLSQKGCRKGFEADMLNDKLDAEVAELTDVADMAEREAHPLAQDVNKLCSIHVQGCRDKHAFDIAATKENMIQLGRFLARQELQLVVKHEVGEDSVIIHYKHTTDVVRKGEFWKVYSLEKETGALNPHARMCGSQRYHFKDGLMAQHQKLYGHETYAVTQHVFEALLAKDRSFYLFNPFDPSAPVDWAMVKASVAYGQESEKAFWASEKGQQILAG